jgi:hypothetical protein
MPRFAAAVTCIVIAVVTVFAPKQGLLAASVAIGLGCVVFWFVTLVDLLRRGPGVQREWWLASLAVVVLLRPVGALAYRLAAPRFELDSGETRVSP